MQLQQLRTQNQLLQQLVATLERQIQSKNQEQSIMIQELEHLIRENDGLSGRYNLLLAESRDWAKRERYLERVVREGEEALGRMRVELGECQRRLAVRSVEVVGTESVGEQNGNGLNPETRSSPQIQIPNTLQTTSHLYISVPKLHMHQQNQPHTSLINQKTPPTQLISPVNQLPPLKSQQHQAAKNLEQEIKSLKTLSESLKLQLAAKNVELGSKTQKIHQLTNQMSELTQQLQTLQNNQYNLEQLIDELKRQNEQLTRDLQQKRQEIQQKDEKFFEMYRQMDEEWRGKLEVMRRESANLQNNREAVEMMKQEVEQLRTKNEELDKSRNQMVGEIRELAAEVETARIVLHEKESELGVVYRENSQLKGRISEDEIQLKRLQSQSHSQCDGLKSEVIQLQSSLLQLRQEVAQLTKQKATLTLQASQAKSSQQQLRNELKESQNLFSQTQHIILQLQEENQSLMKLVQTARSHNHSLQTELQSRETYLRLLEQSVAKGNESNDLNNKRQEQTGDKESLESLQKQNSQLREQVNEFAKNFQEIGISVQEMRNCIDELEGRVAEKEQELKEKEQENSEILRQQQLLKGQIEVLLNENLQLKLQFSRAKLQQPKLEQSPDQLSPKNLSPVIISSSPSSNHIDLEIFEVLQQEYTKLLEETQETKLQHQEEIRKLIGQIKQKDEEIAQVKRKLQDLTRLFSEERRQNEQLRESIDRKPSSNSKIVFKPAQRQQLNLRQMARSQEKSPSPLRHQQARQLQESRPPSFPHRASSNNYYTQNLVENNLSSARSHQQKTPDELISDGMNQQFEIRVQPTQRKSDLPLHSAEFLENTSEMMKPVRPKSNITQMQVDESHNAKREAAELNRAEVDINFLRNSIAEFGIGDIDFNAIAKHIGLEVREQEEQKRNTSDEKVNRVNHDNGQSAINNEKQSEGSAKQEHEDRVIDSQESIQNNDHQKLSRQIHSSYGSNLSQKRSTPSGLRVPHVDQQLMRSSYGSNNQFTQIVLYYEEELGKLRRQIQRLGEEVMREREVREERIERLMIVERENEELRRRVKEGEVMLNEVKNELDLKEREEYAREMEHRIKLHYSQQSSQLKNPDSNYPQTIHPITFHSLPQTSQFRTSIQPLIPSNRPQFFQGNPTTFTLYQQQQEKAQLIKELSSQLELAERKLSQKQGELQSQQRRIELLEGERLGLEKELEAVKKENQNIVSQFSQLSLQQNSEIAGLQTRLQHVNYQLEETKNQLIRANQLNEHFARTNQSLTAQHQTRLNQLQCQLTEKDQMFQKITIENVQYETQILQLSQQVQQLAKKLEEVSLLQQKSTEQKESITKKLQKGLKESREQVMKLSNENQTLAKEFSTLIRANGELQLLNKKYNELQMHARSLQSTNKSLESTNKSLQSTTKTLQQKLAKLAIARRQGCQSPVFSLANQRMSDLMQPTAQNCLQQNLTINNISNIHAIVDQLGDESFVVHEREREMATLKEVVERQRKEIEQLVEEAKEREGYVGELEDRLASVENAFNSQMMGIKRQNAEMNAQLLKLKKQLFTYQKDAGDIDKFIQENFMREKVVVPKRFSVQGQEEQFQPKISAISQQINRSQKNNNSFNLEAYNAHEMSGLSSRNRANMTQFYDPIKERYQREREPQKGMNMGELFVGRKTRVRQVSKAENGNSLSQLIRNITAGNKQQKSFTQVTKPYESRQQSSYSKYLTEYQKYEQKIRMQSRTQPTYQVLRAGFVGHMQKRSEHGEE